MVSRLLWMNLRFAREDYDKKWIKHMVSTPSIRALVLAQARKKLVRCMKAVQDDLERRHSL